MVEMAHVPRERLEAAEARIRFHVRVCDQLRAKLQAVTRQRNDNAGQMKADAIKFNRLIDAKEAQLQAVTQERDQLKQALQDIGDAYGIVHHALHATDKAVKS